MEQDVPPVLATYEQPELVTQIRRLLERRQGPELAGLTVADLAPLDAFHLRGRVATAELAAWVVPAPGDRILDAGCGLGGTSRYLVQEFGSQVTGVDLTPSFVSMARSLSSWVGLSGPPWFEHASLGSLPFPAASFDIAWMEHVQVNIADKRAMLGELRRVLVPGGRLVLHEIFRANQQPLDYPVPWADCPQASHLVTAASFRQLLGESGFQLTRQRNVTSITRQWLRDMQGKFPPPPDRLGTHLLMGPEAATKVSNLLNNLLAGRLQVQQWMATSALPCDPKHAV